MNHPATQTLAKEIEKFSGYSWDDSDVFRALILMALSQMSFDAFVKERDEMVKPFLKEHKDVLNHLFRLLFNAYHEGIEVNGWHDPLGDLYMDISSRNKRQGFGQFFTPVEVCDMMSRMQITEEMKGKTISDPTCGSGRTLLSAKAIAPNNFFFAEDLDPLCCRMTLLNMAVHGCEGEVVHHNSLMPDHWIDGWRLERSRGSPLIEIKRIDQAESYIYKYWESRRKGNEPVEGSPISDIIKTQEKAVRTLEQLTIF
jgi:type I restriction enzyme M protein